MQNKSCILIVDDEERGREALEMLLFPENYQLAFAASGEEALQQAAILTPDLILLDVMMPGMDGYEVCSRLRAHTLLAEVPIIIVTALDDRNSRLQGIEAGADDFITKPFDRVELRARVRTITRLNRYRRLLAERFRFELVVRQSHDGYLLVTQDDIIQYANPAACEYLGCDLLHKNHSYSTSITCEYLSEGNYHCVKGKFLSQATQRYRCEPTSAWENWPLISSKATVRYLVRSETAHEPSLWLQVEVLELPPDEDGTRLVHLHDVSEQMQLERQMWTFQTLVSHKLRAPLNGLVSLQLLSEKDVNLSTERSSSLLNIARESAKRLKTQILEILKYVDTSKLLKKPDKFCELQQLYLLLTTIAVDLELKPLIISIPNSLQTFSLAIALQNIELIFREILTNAKKFHPQQSPQVEVSVIFINTDQVLIQIIDDGQSIATEELHKVWMPYYQVEKSFTGEIKGMGLGLAMVAKLVWSSGGSCRLMNRDNQAGVIVELFIKTYPNVCN